MYQELMLDVHRQWLAEFDQKQAIQRLVPRRERRRRGISVSAALLRLVRPRRQERQPALACRLPDAPQCV